MRNIQAEYKRAADSQPIPNNLFERTKTRMRQQAQGSPKKNRWSIIVPVCALAAFGTISAAAYGAYPFAHSAYQARIKDSMPSAVTLSAGAAVNQTDTTGKLSVTIQKTVCDGKSLYLSLTVKSTDGKPLQESSEFRKSQLMRERFAQSSLKIDGNDYECTMFRTDNASIADQASFEGISCGDFTGLSGKSATLTLKDFTDKVFTCEDAGFLFRNLGQLYAKMTPEKPQNFIRTGLFNVYADKSLIAPSWTIPAGKQKIKFSSQFPDAYIDNIGFHKTGEYNCWNDVLYISIVPGSQSEIPALKKLCFQNLNTMQPVYFEDGCITGNGIEQTGYASQEAFLNAMKKEQERKLTYNSGRIVIALDTFFDGSVQSSDCSAADLSRYRMIKNYKSETVPRCSGTWNIPFTLRFRDTTRKFTLDKTYKTPKGHKVAIQNIDLSDLSLSFSGKCYNLSPSDELVKSDLSPNNIQLIIKDGSTVDVGAKIGGGINADGSFEFDGNLQTFVDADQVTAIRIFGIRIPLGK